MEAQSLHYLNEVSAKLDNTPGKPGDLLSTLRHIAKTAQEAFHTHACIIIAFNPITGKYTGSQTIIGDKPVEYELYHERPRPNGVTQQVLRDGILLIEDVDDESFYHNSFIRQQGIHSFAGVALRTRHRKKPLGVIYLDYQEPRQFSIIERESYQIYAVQASFLLQETWLARHYEEVSRFGQEVNHNLSTVDELFQILQTYIDTVFDETHTFMLSVYHVETNMQDMFLSERRSIHIKKQPLKGACEYIINTQKPYFIEQLSREAENLPFQIINMTGTKEKESFIFAPLMLRGSPLGVLSIQHDLPKAYGQEDQFVFQLLASYIALALHNMRLYGSLNQLNETGQLLTQLLESENTLQATADQIRNVTQADVVVLYPYEPLPKRFVNPPLVSGNLLDSRPELMFHRKANNMAYLMLQREKPIFAKESQLLYTDLQGDIRIRQGDFRERERIHSTAALPLRVGDDIVGVLFVNFRQQQRFDSTQKLLIEGLAHYAAVGMKNSQVFGTLSLRRIQELTILQHIDRELSQTLDLKTVLNTLLQLAQEHVPAEEASILLHNAQTRMLETAAAIGHHAEESLTQTLSLEQRGITRWVVENKRPAHVSNVRRDLPWKDLHLPVTDDTISELDVPLLDGDEVVGVLNFESTREAAFSQEDEDFLLTLSGQAVLAIKNALAYDREKRLLAEAQVLNQISKELISQLDSAYIFAIILDKALELTQSIAGNLMIYDPERNDLWMAAERGVAEDKKGARQSIEEGVVGYVARRKKLLNVDLSQLPWNKIYVPFIPGMCSELAVPMLAGSELRGVLNIESLSPHAFNEWDERLLLALADLALVALQNAQAYEREKRLADESQVLNAISKEITSQLDLAHVFDLILENALELTHSNLCSLMLYEADQHDLKMAAERGVASDKKGLRQKLHQGIVGYVASTKQLLNVDPTQSPWNEVYLEFSPGTRSELAVPMLAGIELRGVLNVESPLPHNFSERDERLLQGLADLAVVALQNAQAYEREKRFAEESHALNAISREITSQLDLNRVFDLILENALQLARCTLGSLHLYDPDKNDLTMAAERGVDEKKRDLHLSLDRGIVGYVARNREPVNVEDVHEPPWSEIYEEFIAITRSELAVPMLAGNELRGVLNVESAFPGHFNESDERLLQGLADLAVVALQNAERYKKAESDTQRFELLYQAGQQLSEITNLAQIDRAYEIIVQIAATQSQSQSMIYLYDEVNTELILVCASPYGQARVNEKIALREGLNGYVARKRETLVIDDRDHLPVGISSTKLSDPGMHSYIITPIMFKDQYYGNLDLRHEEIGRFRGTGILFFEGLAQQLANTIHRLETAKAHLESEQRALAAEEMSSIGQSAYEVTHRLGNDLGLVGTYVEEIQSEMKSLGTSSVFIDRKLGNILQSVQTVLSFSRNLKQELAKLGAHDEAPGEPVIVSPDELLQEAAKTPISSPNIEVFLHIDEDVAPVNVFPDLVTDILQNLVTNAIQAMPEGGKLTLGAHNAGHFIALEVSDTGIGIPGTVLSNIFDLFFSTKGSSGFGLWSARRNALRNHGDLKVESKSGRGTTFTLLLPRVNGNGLNPQLA